MLQPRFGRPPLALRIPLLLAAFLFRLPLATADTTADSTEIKANNGNAGGSAEAVDTVGLWLGFILLVVVSGAETAASLVWTRFRVTADGTHPPELSCRVCGREIFVLAIGADAAAEIAEHGMPAGFFSGTHTSMTTSQWDVVTSSRSTSHGCSTCGGAESRRTQIYHGATEVVVDKYASVMLLPTLLIRRFNPMTSLEAPSGLLDSVKALLGRKGGRNSLGRTAEHVVHLAVGLLDVSLGVAGLARNPAAPEALYDTLSDPAAPMTFDNYLTLFLLFWLLGAVLLVCMIPLRSQRRSIQMFGWPWMVAFVVASLANLVLFGLGCWKIDVARRAGAEWTPMLTYWIGGASAIGLPMCGVEVFHTFGVVGLIFMLIHTF